MTRPNQSTSAPFGALHSPARLGAALMVIAGILFAVINLLGQYGTMVQGIAPTRLAFWQYFIAFLFSLPWVLTRIRHAFRTEQLPLHILRVILSAGGVQLWVMGLSSVPICRKSFGISSRKKSFSG